LPVLLICLMALVIFGMRQYGCTADHSPGTGKQTNPGSEEVNRDRGFDRRTAFIEYSNHAKCRMECRQISRAEVEEIMLEGKINYSKSDLKNSRCPRYALEGVTNDNQRVRIVYAQCNTKTTVVTVIDLEREWTCDCPGDDDKFKNRN
jgi:hypothetical protein